MSVHGTEGEQGALTAAENTLASLLKLLEEYKQTQEAMLNDRGKNDPDLSFARLVSLQRERAAWLIETAEMIEETLRDVTDRERLVWLASRGQFTGKGTA